jgi:hypothetical protein
MIYESFYNYSIRTCQRRRAQCAVSLHLGGLVICHLIHFVHVDIAACKTSIHSL